MRDLRIASHDLAASTISGPLRVGAAELVQMDGVSPQKVLEKDLGGRFGNGLFPNDSGGVIRRLSFSIGGWK